MLKFAAIAALAMLAAPAVAQCPATAVQDTVNLQVEAAEGADPAAAAKKAEMLASQCGEDAYVLKVVAMTFAVAAQRLQNPDLAIAHSAKARSYAMQARDKQPDNEKSVTAGYKGQWVAIKMFGDNFDRDILMNVLQVEQRTGKLTPETQPLQPGEKLRACRKWDSVEGGALNLILSDNIKSPPPGGVNLLNRLIAICDGQMSKTSMNINLIGHRARLNYKLVAADPKRPNAKVLLDQAVADSKRFFDIFPSGDTAYWSTWDRDRLKVLQADFAFLSGDLPPESDWFKPGNPEKPETVRAIAAKLDEAWAIDGPKGIAGGYKTYRDLISDLVYQKAFKSGNIDPSKRAIALAARGHATGKFRKPETQGLPKPPDFLWTWVDPTLPPEDASGK